MNMQVRYNELTDFEELNVQNEAQAKITIFVLFYARISLLFCYNFANL